MYSHWMPWHSWDWLIPVKTSKEIDEEFFEAIYWKGVLGFILRKMDDFRFKVQELIREKSKK
jgi:hypothetical protein